MVSAAQVLLHTNTSFSQVAQDVKKRVIAVSKEAH